MAHPFSAKEKEIIDRTLLKKGREMFGRAGLTKTSVADLTKAAGIAQRSFYIYYQSKEELFFAILEEEEKKIHNALCTTHRQRNN